MTARLALVGGARRARLKALVAAAVAGVTTLVTTAVLPVQPAAADTTPPPGTPETVAADALPTVQIDGVAWSQAVVGNTVYVGGSFATARPAGSRPGQNTVPRRNLLRYDVRNGNLDTGWAPQANAQIRAVAKSPDGRRVYVGGDFTSIAGQTRYRIAAFDAATGALLGSFAPILDYQVRAIAATNTTVYVGGAFSKANNTARSRVAAFSAANGALLPWNPRADNGTVSALAVSPDQGAVFIGGNFTSFNGSSNPGYGLARVNATTGAMLPLPANSIIRNGGEAGAILDLKGDANNVYAIGYTWGRAGGTLEGTAAIRWSDGAFVWVADCHGDSYSVFPHGSVVYNTSHAHYCGNIGSFGQTDPHEDWTYYRGIALTKNPTRTVGREPLGYTNYEGRPGPTVLNFFPEIDWGTYTGQNQGAWSISGNDQYVVFGGEFRNVNFRGQQGLVRFAVKAVAPNKTGPRYNGENFPITAKAIGNGAVRVSWQANADPDNESLVYRVIRNGVTGSPVNVQTFRSQMWKRPWMGFTDTSVQQGSSYSYRVTVTDPYGNTASSPTVTATANAGGSVGPYAQEVLRDGASHYWRLGETGSTAVDIAASNNATFGGGVAKGRPGAIGGDPNGAADLGTGSGGWIQSGQRYLTTNYFSIEAWIKPGSGDRGRLVGFGSSNSTSGTSSQRDRHLYLDSGGRITFGVNPTAIRTIRSPEAYNDGKWHHVVGTMGADGLRLYVDGRQVAHRADGTVGGNYWGYWRIGGDNLSGWPNRPSGDNYGGLIDEVAIYPDPISAATVMEHYELGAANREFFAVTPARLADTRGGRATVDGRVAGVGAVGGGSVLRVPVTGRGGVPASGVGSVVLNVTVTETTGSGHVTAFPTGTSRPNASNVNYVRGQTVANLVTVKPGSDGTVSLYASTTTHMIVDVQSWSPNDQGIRNVNPARLADTRSGRATVDGRTAGTGSLGPGGVLKVPVLGRGGVPSSGVGTVLLNVTATLPSSGGHVTAWPTGTARPNASNLNYRTGQTVPNLVAVRPGSDGTVSLYSSAPTHLIVDVQGWSRQNEGVLTVNPARLVDTRAGRATVDGRLAGTGPVGTGGVLRIPVRGRGGVPGSGVGAVVLNVTVTQPVSGGYVSVWPSDRPRPNASNVNYGRGQTVANLVTVKPSADGHVNLYASAGTHVIVDVQGWSR